MGSEIELLREFFDAYVDLEHSFSAEATHRAIARFNRAKRAVFEADSNKEAGTVHVIGGEKQDGRLLDGRSHDGFPEVQP